MNEAVRCDEIRWTLESDPEVDPLTLSDVEERLLLLSEGATYRTMAIAATHALHRQDQELTRLRTSHHALIDQHRALRAKAAA
ncbi:MAG: hypothetical protein AB7N65_16900 [Vicinamibacterales bacterium]